MGRGHCGPCDIPLPGLTREACGPCDIPLPAVGLPETHRGGYPQAVCVMVVPNPLACSSGSASCALCFEPLQLEDFARMPCTHGIHRICMARLTSPDCPLCSEALPFSWFLPQGHPLSEEGWQPVVRPEDYRPGFPGGPSRPSGGYPLHRPPPSSLHMPDGSAMRSYLHRAVGAGEEPIGEEPTGESSGAALGLHLSRVGFTSDSGGVASDSESERGSVQVGMVQRRARRRARRWAYHALGRMSLMPKPSPGGEGSQQGGSPSEALSSPAIQLFASSSNG